MNLNKFAIINKHLVFMVGVAIFFVPFFWFSNNQIILGGESFLIPDPSIAIKKIIYTWGDYILGLPNINITTELYQLLNYVLSQLFSVSIVQKIIFGLFLSGPFFSFYVFIKKIFNKSDNKLAILASLFYVFNPFYVITFGWIPTYGFLFILFPLLFFQVIKILGGSASKISWVYLAIISFLASVTGLNLALFGLIFLFILAYYIALIFFSRNDFMIISKKTILVFLVIILMNIFWIMPVYNYRKDLFGDAVINKASFSANSLFSSPILNGLTLNQYFWFNKIDAAGNLYYPFSSWYYFPSKLSILILIILIIYLQASRGRPLNYSNKKFKIFFLALLIAGVFLSKGTASPFGEIYKVLLENINFFGIYRASDIKFPFLVVFSISFFIYYSLKYTSNFMKMIIFILIFFLGSPFIFGKIFKDEMKISIPQYWRSYNTQTNSSRLSSRILLFPKNNSPFDNYTWGYEGAWLTSQLNRKNSVGYSQGYGSSRQESFLKSSEATYSFFEKNNAKSMIASLNKFSIKQILQRNDFDMENSKYYSENRDLYKENIIKEFFSENKEYFYLQKSFDDLQVYSLKNEYYLPHIYTPKINVLSDRTIEYLPKIISDMDLEIRSAVFLKDQNPQKNLEFLKGQAVEGDGVGTPILEFKKINPTKYRVRVHSTNGKFPLVFSESFHDGWRAYIAQVESPKLKVQSNLENYKILDGNEDDQATKEDLADFIQKGLVTNLGDQKEKEIKHMKWDSDKQKEVLDYVEKYNIDFISKNFQGTIQNDNLSSGNIFETWMARPWNMEHKTWNTLFSNKNTVELPEENHLMVNGYANSWVIDTDEVCNNSASCVKNSDGSYDMEIIVEFWPQRLFYVGLGISGTTLLVCIGYLMYNYKRRKYAKNETTIE